MSTPEPSVRRTYVVWSGTNVEFRDALGPESAARQHVAAAYADKLFGMAQNANNVEIKIPVCVALKKGDGTIETVEVTLAASSRTIGFEGTRRSGGA